MEEKYSIYQLEGNVFSIIGTVQEWMEENGLPKEEIKAYAENCQKSNSYEEILKITQKVIEKLNRI